MVNNVQTTTICRLIYNSMSIHNQVLKKCIIFRYYIETTFYILIIILIYNLKCIFSKRCIVTHTAHFIRGTSWERRNWMSLGYPLEICAVGKSNKKF